MAYFAALAFILALRLAIWKFFPGLDSGTKDELSNMIIASLIFGLAIGFFTGKALRREGVLKSGLEGPLALFIAAATVSVASTADTGASVKALIMLLAHVFFFYILLESLAVESFRRIFSWFFFLAAVVVAAMGINDILLISNVSAQVLESARLTNNSLYYILTHKRACSVFGWPNVLAAFLMLAMPLGAALFLFVRGPAARSIVLAGMAVLVGAFFLTFSFLGWSVFLFTSMGMFLLLLKNGIIKVAPAAGRYLAAGSLAAAVLFTGVIMKKDFAESMAPRKDYARVVAKVIGGHPWAGTGFGAYRFASLKFVTTQDGMTAFPHNSYAQVWAETGLPGLAAVLWLLLACGSIAAGRLRRMADGPHRGFFIAVTLGLAAFFVDNTFSFTMLKPNIAFFFWAWLAVFCAHAGLQDGVLPCAAGHRRRVMSSLAVAAAAGLLLSVCSIISWVSLLEGNKAAEAGRFIPAQKAFERSVAFDPLSSAAVTAQGNFYLRAFRSIKQPALFDLAKLSFVRAADLSPNAYYNYLALASMASMRNDQVRVDQWLARSRSVSPYETARDLEALARQKK